MHAAIIGREITMSALREWAAGASKEARKAVAVNNWGKWKTATQVGTAPTRYGFIICVHICASLRLSKQRPSVTNRQLNTKCA